MIIAAMGGYAMGTGEPVVAWYVSFDGGETFLRPVHATPLDPRMPEKVLWKGTEPEYKELMRKGYPGIQWPPINADGGEA